MATNRDLIYRMSADPEAFKKGMREAGKDSNLFYKELRQLEKQQRVVDELMTTSGVAIAGFGAAVGVGLGLAAKAAIDWESAWTGVAKVVDGSPEQMAALEEELRGLATTLPQTHAEIAGVAAAAGQLGIAREDIAEFTQTMVAMGVSTDLASEDAAMGMARLMNIMQTAPDNVSNLGSAIVGLGNAGASTEAEIVEMALRIAGAGHTVGMTEADVLAFSSALASVGIEAESGGSSISTAMIKIAEAVNEGGEALDKFANVAGVSADEFAQKFESDPAAAINMFVQGLGRIQDSGGDVFGVLESLGMSEIRLRDALLRLAGAGDLLTESLDTGNEAWDENSALMEEAARRYGTTEAQMAIAKNQVIDFGISMGEFLLPIVGEAAAGVGALADVFNDLPDGVKVALAIIAGLTAVIALAGGGALIAIPKIAALKLALLELGATKTIATLGFLTGPWGIGIAAAATVAVGAFAAFSAAQAKARARTNELADTLDQETAAITENSRAWAANELNKVNEDAPGAMMSALEAAEKLGLELSTVTDAALGNAAATEEVRDAYMGAYEAIEQFLAAHDLTTLAEADESLQSEVDALIADAEAADVLKREMEGLNGTYEDAVESTEREIAAREESTGATADASAEVQILAEQLGITTGAATEAADSFSALDEKVRALIDSAFALNGAQRDVEAGIDAITEKLEENGATVDRNTESGRENEAAIEDQIAAIAQLAITTAEQTGSTEEANAVLEEERQRLIDVMKAAGFTSEEIDSYIGVLDAVPSEIETAIETSGLSSAIRGAQSLGDAIHNIPSYKRVVIDYERTGIPPPSGEQPYADGGIVGYANGGIAGFPGGGLFKGRGGPRSDSNIIAVSNGEFIVNAASTKRHRALLEAINSGIMPTGGMDRSPMPVHRFGSGSGGEVTVSFDFSNVSGSLERAIKESVRLNGDGVVQAAFGTK